MEKKSILTCDEFWIPYFIKNTYLIFVLIIFSDLQSGGGKTICSANDYVFNV